MSKAGNVRVKPTKIDIDNVTYELKYDFNAFIELEEAYGSVDEAMKIMQGELIFDKEGKPVMVEELDKDGKVVFEEDGKTPKKIQKRKISFKAIRDFLWCGLLYSDENITKIKAGKLMEFSNFKYIIEKIIEAITASMPKVVDDAEKN